MATTAADILKIRDPAALFAGDAAAVKATFRGLAKLWHPDRNKSPEAVAVFEHIANLRDIVLKGEVPQPIADNTRVFTSDKGATFRLRFLTRHHIDAGEVFVTSRAIVYRIEKENEDLANDAVLFTPQFADDRMRESTARCTPQFIRRVDTEQGTLLFYKRTPDQILLADLLGSQGPIEPVHAAWMISGMANLGAWLTWATIAHGDIGRTTLLISPKYHSVALTGPLLYRTAFGVRPRALPERSLGAVPRMAIAGVTIDAKVDLELIRLTAREILGDAGGAGLLRRPDVPRQVAMWTMTPPAKNGVADYASWERARDAGFGKRTFVEMKIPPGAIYPA